MENFPYPWQFALISMAGWMNRHQQAIIDTGCPLSYKGGDDYEYRATPSASQNSGVLLVFAQKPTPLSTDL